MRRTFRLGFGRGHVERDVDDELAFHIDMRTERLVAGGMAPDAARAEALRQFGAITPVRESCVALDEDRERVTRRLMMIDDFRQDLAYAARTLRRNPGFAAIVALTIALGVGANTAIFTLVDAVMLRTLDVPAPERLVAIGDPARTAGLSQGTPRADLISYPLYQDLVRESRATTAILATGRASGPMAVVVAPGRETEHLRARFVSGNYFAVLGLHAGAGRALTAADDRPGATPVVVISDDLWTRRFERSPDAIGRAIRVNDVAATIVGVGPAGWTGEIVGDPREMWLPLAMQPLVMPNQKLLDDREQSWLLLLGRLRPGVSVDEARLELTPLIRRLIVDNMSAISVVNRIGAERVRELPVFVGSGARGFSSLRGHFATPLLTLMAGVGLLLLIVCANVANLLLARSVARGREMSVRLAIGAGRGRLVRQLLTESLVLALLGAAGGLLLASWGARLLLTLANQSTRTLPVSALDLRVLGFTVVVSLLAVALFGLAPALGASRIDLASSLRAGGRALHSAHAGARRRSPASLLIGVQVALSLLLLIGTGLLVRSLQQLQNGNPGLDRDRLLIVEVDPASRGYSGARLQTLARELAARLTRLPGVAAVSYSVNGIFSGSEGRNTVQVEGFHATTYEDTVVYTDQVGPDYVRAIGGRLLAGRDISARDDEKAAPVVLVNETLARFYFPNGDAIGRRLTFDTVNTTIVGIVADVKDHELRGKPVRRAYASYAQPTTGAAAALVFEVRAEREPGALVKNVRKEIVAVDPSLPIYGVDPLAQLMKDSIRQERLLARLSLAFGALALVLASVGLFGVMSYAVTRRTGEIGVRVALGAQRAQVLRMVLWDALRIVLGGMAIGLPAALLAARLLRAQLYGVGVTDPVALVAAVAVLLASGAVASLAPALRASRVAPAVALRAE